MKSSEILRATYNEWTYSNWAFLGFVAFLGYQFYRAIYHLYLSPLANCPGPFLAKISSWPSFYHSIKRDRHIWIWQCFQIYGSKFRAKPTLVLFNTPKAFRDIYSYKANVKKDESYVAWRRNDGDANTLTTTDVAVHARKRKLLNIVFSDNSVRSAAAFIIKNLDRWNELSINGDDWSEPIDLSKWTDCLIFDILGDLCFGKSFDIKEPGENPFKVIPEAIISHVKFWHPVTKSPLLDVVLWLKPRGLDQVFDWLIPEKIRLYYDFLDHCVTERGKQEEDLQKSGGQGTNIRKDMFHYIYQAKDPETGQPAYSKDEMLAEASLLHIAGSDTTSVTLCGFFFYIMHYPHVYAKLVKQIRNSFASVDEIVEGHKLSSCQYLRACLDEALRMTPVGTSEFPRTILPGGQEIDGEIYPEGVNVGTNSWAYGRNDQIYGDANIYRPERWIVDETNGITAESVAQIKSSSHPFSAGPGNCVGQNLAILEMLLITARTLYRMDVRLAPGFTLGEGTAELGWGRRDKNQFQVEDGYVALKHGPMVQFRKRQF